jgi:hypothetical protein
MHLTTKTLLTMYKMLDDKTQAFSVVLLSNDSVFRLFIMCINVREHRRGNQLWTVQRHWQY